jgi:hypothetical protein
MSYRKKISEKEKREVMERCNSKCVFCGSTNALEFDHIFPLALGGEDSTENLQILCGRCNRRKHTRCKTKIIKEKVVITKYEDTGISYETFDVLSKTNRNLCETIRLLLLKLQEESVIDLNN